MGVGGDTRTEVTPPPGIAGGGAAACTVLPDRPRNVLGSVRFIPHNMNGTSPMHRPLARAIAASTAVVLSLSLLLAPPAVSEETDEPPADPNLWDYFWNGLTHAVGGGSFGAVIHIEPELDGSGDVAGVRGLEIAP